MKVNVSAKPMWNKDKTALTLGKAKVFADLKDIPNGAVIIPVALTCYKRDGHLGEARSSVKQAGYSKNGKWWISFLTVHLNKAAREFVETLVGTEWLKKEVKRLIGLKKETGKVLTSEYDLIEGELVHDKDSEYTAQDGMVDDWVSEMAEMADELAAEQEKNAPKQDAEKVAEEGLK